MEISLVNFGSSISKWIWKIYILMKVETWMLQSIIKIYFIISRNVLGDFQIKATFRVSEIFKYV